MSHGGAPAAERARDGAGGGRGGFPAVELSRPLLAFAVFRVAVAVVALTLSLALVDLPERSTMIAYTAGVGLPWTLGVLLLTLRRPHRPLSVTIAIGDLLVLAALQIVAPVSFGAVRPVALFLIAVHAHFGDERRGVTIAGLAVALLVVPAAIQDAGPVDVTIHVLWETAFAIAAMATGMLGGRLVAAESASRVRARGLSRRTIRSESEVRRRVAESIHDGPVQDLIGLDMVLSTASQAVAAGDPERAAELIGEARGMAAHNVEKLRDEIVDLGPYAFEELDFPTAVDNWIPTWRRRYDFEVMARIDALPLPAETAGLLFRITQEAVANAGRHAHADAVSIRLRRVAGELELRVVDDGRGFGRVDPFAASNPGHLGIESMRERAELLDGSLLIESSPRGTTVLVRAPLRAPA